MESLEEVENLLRRLSGQEREIVRLYYLEGRSYEEISTERDVPVNTIGAVLSRARKKLRAKTTDATEDTPVLRESIRPSTSIKPTKPTKSKAIMEPLPEEKTEAEE